MPSLKAAFCHLPNESNRAATPIFFSRNLVWNSFDIPFAYRQTRSQPHIRRAPPEGIGPMKLSYLVCALLPLLGFGAPAPKRRRGNNARLEVKELENRVVPTTGAWNPVTNLSESVTSGYTAGIGTMLELTNGVILAQGGGITTGSNGQPQELVTNTWFRLTPNTSGDTAGSYGGEYANGAWTAAGSTLFARQYFATNVLPSGKIFLAGGELAVDQFGSP
jgi:hypothetical protein